MYAYEDIHNGILVKYLKKYLPKQISVLEVFTSVQEGMEGNYFRICHLVVQKKMYYLFWILTKPKKVDQG